MTPLPPKKVVKLKETNREKAFRKQQKEASEGTGKKANNMFAKPV